MPRWTASPTRSAIAIPAPSSGHSAWWPGSLRDSTARNSGRADWPKRPSERPPWPWRPRRVRGDCSQHEPESPMPSITYDRSGHLAHVSLNRPDHGNRFSMEMLATLGTIFTEADADPDIRCTLLTANGNDFSLGVDVPDVLLNWAAGKSPFADRQINPFGTTGPKRRKPLVTVVQGQCFNAGLELALASDISVAADSARFAFHEMRFGVYPFGGGLFRLIRAAGWNAAMRYCLTAAEFDAQEAFRMNV